MSNQCGRKSALSIFFTFSLLGFTFSLLALLSPNWQFVYLENGRTEHHHGLWLDCIRAYSHDYGRTREYYETLARRDLQGSPFEMFYLPPLDCVYKFDYWIDPEDLFDHDHDENRLQNDAYQHMWAGWKIGALAGVLAGVICSGCAVMLGVCAFCHKTFTVVCIVFVTLAAILSTIGVSVFYGWANFQDNKIIKEEGDTIYEQFLGWAFWFQVVGCVLNFLASFLGCCVASLSFGKSRAKLVKIELSDPDESLLLSSRSSQPFKRSFSAIYRVDSNALRQWEREAMHNVRNRPMASTRRELQTFKRTSSVPNFTKKQPNTDRNQNRQVNSSQQEIFHSASNITEFTNTGSNLTLGGTIQTRNSAQTAPAGIMSTTSNAPILKSALKTTQQQRSNITMDDPNYEYLPCDSTIGLSTINGGARAESESLIYDPVYEQLGLETYLEPNSVRARNSMASGLNVEADHRRALRPTQPTSLGDSRNSTAFPKTTVIDDIPTDYKKSDTAVVTELSQLETVRTSKFMGRSAMKPPSTPSRDLKPAMNIRDFGIDLSQQRQKGCAKIIDRPGQNEGNQFQAFDKPPDDSIHHTNSKVSEIDERLAKLSGRRGHNENIISEKTASTHDSFDDSSTVNRVAINTFGYNGRPAQRSITNLTGRNQSAGSVFERDDSVYESEKNSSLIKKLQKNLVGNMPEEVDRSVGSSTLLENEVVSEAGSYAREAAVRLNLFLKDKDKNQDETTV